MKRFFRALKNMWGWFKSDRIEVVESDSKEPTKLPPVEVKVPVPVEPKPQEGLFAWVVGHNSRSKGANNYLKESEFDFSSRILRKAQIKLKARGYKSIIVFRPPVSSYSRQARSVAKECKERNVKFAICSHFNSAGESARGCEFLVPKSSTKLDDKMADMATDLINERLGLKERHHDGVKTLSSGHRGAGMLFGLKNEGIICSLAEPCFAGYETEESIAIFQDEDKYVDILVDVAESCCNGTLEAYQED